MSHPGQRDWVGFSVLSFSRGLQAEDPKHSNCSGSALANITSQGRFSPFARRDINHLVTDGFVTHRHREPMPVRSVRFVPLWNVSMP